MIEETFVPTAKKEVREKEETLRINSRGACQAQAHESEKSSNKRSRAGESSRTFASGDFGYRQDVFPGEIRTNQSTSLLCLAYENKEKKMLTQQYGPEKGTVTARSLKLV